MILPQILIYFWHNDSRLSIEWAGNLFSNQTPIVPEVASEPFGQGCVMNTTGIWSEKLRLSGKPCIRGQRFSMAQLADGRPLKEIAEDFDIDYNKDQVDAIKKGPT